MGQRIFTALYNAVAETIQPGKGQVKINSGGDSLSYRDAIIANAVLKSDSLELNQRDHIIAPQNIRMEGRAMSFGQGSDMRIEGETTPTQASQEILDQSDIPERVIEHFKHVMCRSNAAIDNGNATKLAIHLTPDVGYVVAYKLSKDLGSDWHTYASSRFFTEQKAYYYDLEGNDLKSEEFIKNAYQNHKTTPHTEAEPAPIN